MLKECQSSGRTVVMVTHDVAAAATADRRLVLRDGKICDEDRGGVKTASSRDAA
jgi:ABC-type lipoprotein export system ATPase subunit